METDFGLNKACTFYRILNLREASSAFVRESVTRSGPFVILTQLVPFQSGGFVIAGVA
jgi:hypothetical protein